MTFFIGAGLLALVLVLLLGVSRMPTALLVTLVRAVLIVGGAVAAVLLLYAGRHLLAAMGPLAALLLWRAVPELVTRWLRRRPVSGGSSGAGGPQSTTVRTAHLAMTMDIATGTTHGEVLSGPRAGRALDSLDLDELRALHLEIAGDPQSLALLEAWLDRVHPAWRTAQSAPNGGPMSRAEALEILGLTEGATMERIKAAHRDLLRKVHPDSGGSTWLAARINQARDVLLP